MTKVTTKKTAVSLLCVCALLLALVTAFAGGGVFNPVSSKAENIAASENLLDLSKPMSDNAGSGFGGPSIRFHWKAGQSGAHWGGMFVQCGEGKRIRDLISLETTDGTSKTLADWEDEGITRV